VQKDVFYWEPKGDQTAAQKQRAKDFDAVDLWYRNAAGPDFNIMKDLGRIKARTLVLHVENDQWLVIGKTRAAVAAIPGAYLASFPHNLAHYAVFRAPNEKRDTVAAFLENRFVGTGAVAGAAQAGGAARAAGLAK
ncbi:MAG: alpha/beta fold hydrolase, partial [Burkholderiales bacterium]